MASEDTRSRGAGPGQVTHRMPVAFLVAVTIMLILNGVSANPKHIHLTWQDDPRTTITVSWRTDEMEPSIVQYGVDGSYGSVATGLPGMMHNVELTDLLPSAAYHYRCGSEGRWSEDRVFKTATADPDAPFSFVAFGDSRTNWETWRTVSQAVLASDAEFSVHTGDLVASGTVQSEWDIWFDYGEPLMSHRVLMPCIGNHENNAPQYFEQFALPGAEQWYSFDYGNAHFVALTTENVMTGPQLEWLENDLASTEAVWKFVFYHRPMYSSGSHGPEISVQNAWRDILDRYHVDMVFNGHDHLYERTYPLFGGEVVNLTDDGTIHIVTGGAGAPLYSIEKENPWTASALSVNHFVLIIINGSSLHLEARRTDQSVFDTLDIHKTLTADLRISSISLSPEIPAPGDNATLSIEVCNAGHVSSGEFSVALVVDGQAVSSMDSSSLEPGGRTVIEALWATGAEGKYNLTALADPDERVKEGILDNNNAVSRMVVVSRPKPDLVPTSVELEEGKIEAGQRAAFMACINNTGFLDSGPFTVRFSAGGLDMNMPLDALPAGECLDVSLPGIEFDTGDWAISLFVDAQGEVDEFSEENNNLTVVVPVRDWIKVGAAYYPRGAIEGEPLIIKYDDGEGVLPEGIPSCAIVWGVNGWAIPGRSPPGSVRVGNNLESVMKRGLDGLWWISIPTGETVKTVDFKFRNGQLVGRMVDDNSGVSWTAPLRGWAVEALEELSNAISGAAAYGVDTSRYESVLALANQSFVSGNYVEAVSIIGNVSEVARREEVLALLDFAEKEYMAAVEEGLSVPRAEVFLEVARDSIETGNIIAAKSFSNSVLRMIDEARSAIGDGGVIMFMFSMATAGILFGDLRRRAN